MLPLLDFYYFIIGGVQSEREKKKNETENSHEE